VREGWNLKRHRIGAMPMRVFVAGSTGVIDRFLVPHLVEQGHGVVGLVRPSQKSKEVEALGAKVAVTSALDKDGLTAAIGKAEPGILILDKVSKLCYNSE
jgi:nucleoside-diphosphate-sugar epimerase